MFTEDYFEVTEVGLKPGDKILWSHIKSPKELFISDEDFEQIVCRVGEIKSLTIGDGEYEPIGYDFEEDMCASVMNFKVLLLIKDPERFNSNVLIPRQYVFKKIS